MTSQPSLEQQKRNQRRAETTSTKSFSSAYLVGIGGSGMKALAELLTGLGWNVTGSDIQQSNPTIQALKRRGVRIHCGHDQQALSNDVDVLVYSPAVGPNNPERRLAHRLHVPQMSYSQMLGRLMQDRVGLSIAGTHGKSTTTAMTACILADADRCGAAIFGAELCRTGQSGWAGPGDLFVAESCEYQRNFLHLHPQHAALLGIEPDHFDCFADFEDLKSAFAEFAAKIPADGTLLVRGDCATSVEIGKGARANMVTFSHKPGADWWATDERRTSTGTRFRVFHHGDFFAEISLKQPGQHNILNALAATAIAHHMGVSVNDIRESLYQFPGIRRRFERVGSYRGVTLLDDYAHHPTAVRATLQTARKEFGNRRIWCAFQPHQVSRTVALIDDFAKSFASADKILIAPVFAARENLSDEPQAVAEELAARIAREGRFARFSPSIDQIIATLEDEALPGDVLITMGAGDIDRVHHEFTRRLQRHHQAR